MHQQQPVLTPFEAFAQNMSGSTVGMGAYSHADDGINLYAGLPRPLMGIGDGLSAIESTPMAYGLLVLGALGLGAAVGQVVSKKPGKYGAAATGAMLQGGATATIVGMFGSSLSSGMRIGFGVAGLGLLAGSFLSRR